MYRRLLPKDKISNLIFQPDYSKDKGNANLPYEYAWREQESNKIDEANENDLRLSKSFHCNFYPLICK